MAAPSLLLPATQREVIRQVTDARLLQIGGYFGRVIPDRDRNHNDLFEIDNQVGTAANLVARGATNVAAPRPINTVVANRAVQMVRHEEIDQEECEWLATVGVTGANDAVRQKTLDIARRIQTRNLEGIRITRGYLLSAMVVGEITWSYLGFNAGTITFGIPAAMKQTPATYWRTAGGVTNATATPLANMFALDYEASILGNTPFTDVGMSYAAYLAMTGTTEYKDRAVGMTTFNSAASIPNAQSQQGMDLASAVVGKRIHILDETFKDPNGAVARYIPEDRTVLWRASDENNSLNWEFGNVPLTKSMIAQLGGANAFPGVVRGPAAWASVESREFTNAGLYAAMEGFPLRRHLAVSATIVNRGGA